MKKLISYSIIFVVGLSFSSDLFGQPLDHLTLIAHYPLKSTANDTIGRYGPMELMNVSYQDGGIYCNGIYPDGVTPNACDARTPYLDALSFHSLAVSAEFKISEYPSVRMPVIVADPIGFRWLYVFVDSDSTLGFGSGSDFDNAPPTSIPCNLQQWYTVTVTWDSVSSQMTFYLDATVVDSAVLTLEHGNSRHAGISHGGVGRTFKGWLRNLKIYSHSTVTEVAGAESGIPAGYVLGQNYPNPFNPQTTIEYEIPQKSRVLIRIYNSLGELVRKLVDEVKPAGSFVATWDGRDQTEQLLASGIYYYKLVVNSQTRNVKRMLLLK